MTLPEAPSPHRNVVRLEILGLAMKGGSKSVIPCIGPSRLMAGSPPSQRHRLLGPVSPSCPNRQRCPLRTPRWQFQAYMRMRGTVWLANQSKTRVCATERKRLECSARCSGRTCARVDIQRPAEGQLGDRNSPSKRESTHHYGAQEKFRSATRNGRVERKEGGRRTRTGVREGRLQALNRVGVTQTTGSRRELFFQELELEIPIRLPL